MCNIYWPACKVVKLKEGDITLSTSLFLFCLISFSPHFIVHVSYHFLQSRAHWSCFMFISFSPQSISFITPTTIHLIHIYLIWLYSYITWSFNHIVSFTFQPILSLEINDLQAPLDKFLILVRYSLLEAELRWFYYSLSLYIKQEIQQLNWLCKHMKKVPLVFNWFLDLCTNLGNVKEKLTRKTCFSHEKKCLAPCIHSLCLERYAIACACASPHPNQFTHTKICTLE